MITDTDIKKMEKVFTTKGELKRFATKEETTVIRREIKSTENYLDHKIETLREENRKFVKDYQDFKNSVLKTLDWLVGAFKKFDEELTVMAHRDVKFEDKLENHESRIKNLETNPVFQ